MEAETSRFGIYLNINQKRVVRITSPYWFPEEPEWLYVTNKVNATLLMIRDLLKEQSLVDNEDMVTWGRIPLKKGYSSYEV